MPLSQCWQRPWGHPALALSTPRRTLPISAGTRRGEPHQASTTVFIHMRRGTGRPCPAVPRSEAPWTVVSRAAGAASRTPRFSMDTLSSSVGQSPYFRPHWVYPAAFGLPPLAAAGGCSLPGGHCLLTRGGGPSCWEHSLGDTGPGHAGWGAQAPGTQSEGHRPWARSLGGTGPGHAV